MGLDVHAGADDWEAIWAVWRGPTTQRLVVGGLDRVYEVGKQFRNEGTRPRLLSAGAGILDVILTFFLGKCPSRRGLLQASTERTTPSLPPWSCTKRTQTTAQ